MKTTEKIDYGFRSDQQFRNDYSSFENGFRIKQIDNQRFIVPWQLVETEKRKFAVE